MFNNSHIIYIFRVVYDLCDRSHRTASVVVRDDCSAVAKAMRTQYVQYVHTCACVRQRHCGHGPSCASWRLPLSHIHIPPRCYCNRRCPSLVTCIVIIILFCWMFSFYTFVLYYNYKTRTDPTKNARKDWMFSPVALSFSPWILSKFRHLEY